MSPQEHAEIWRKVGEQLVDLSPMKAEREKLMKIAQENQGLANYIKSTKYSEREVAESRVFETIGAAFLMIAEGYQKATGT